MSDTIAIQSKVQAWLMGKEDAFEAIFLHYYPRLQRYLVRYLKNETEADDVAMETLTSIWQKKETLTTAATFENYLFTIARNRMINLWRSRVNEMLSLHTATAEEPATSFDPLLTKELENIYKEKVNNLPTQRRTIFMLHRYENLSYKEIARHLNISPKTVENQLSAAVKQLRVAMMQYLTSIML